MSRSQAPKANMRVAAALPFFATAAMLTAGAQLSPLTPPASRSPAGLVNLTVYRVSPLTYPGLLDMDTGDPAGDIGFGMWELMMPMDCRGGSQHNNIGCGGTTGGNGTGKYIRPGDPSNVYEEFKVEANPLFGEYNDCNPILEGPNAGVFACEASDDGSHCVCPGHVGVKWQQMWDDCLNGTVYSSLKVNASTCKERCADDSKCDAYALPDGEGSNICHLLQQPLIFWDDGQHKSGCQAQIKQISSLEVPGSECACYRFNRVAVGKQLNSFGSVPGLPCTNFKQQHTCDDSDGCNWQPACCTWKGEGKGDNGNGWDCSDCCKDCHCCNGDGCDDCDCCTS